MDVGRWVVVRVAFATAAVISCGPSVDPGDGGVAASTDGSGTQGAGSSDGNDATSAPTTDDGPDDTEPDTDSDSGPGPSDDSVGDDAPPPSCDPPRDPPPCELTECVQQWDYDCYDCRELGRGADCFAHALGCAYVPLDCALDSPCERVWVQAFDLSGLEDIDAATCLLTSLRDSVPGRYELIWGEMDASGSVETDIYVLADGSIALDWRVECEGCPNAGSVGRTGVLELQPASFFDDCLADGSEAGLIDCLVGVDTYGPVPEGYTPPFTTGSCTSDVATCP